MVEEYLHILGSANPPLFSTFSVQSMISSEDTSLDIDYLYAFEIIEVILNMQFREKIKYSQIRIAKSL